MLNLLRQAASSILGYGQDGQHTPANRPSASREHGSSNSSKLPQNAHSEQMLALMHETIQKAKRVILEWGSLADLKQLLRACPQVASEVINTRDLSGYNLLQYAIISNRQNIVKYLVTQGAELNVPVCGRPLHLAAKLGHAGILQTLLEYGADPDVISSICHPHAHLMHRTLYSGSSRSGAWSGACWGDVYNAEHEKTLKLVFEYPLYFAIQSDSVECIKILLHKYAAKLARKSSKLHIACHLGAFKCMQYFLQGDLLLRSEDQLGFHPLQYAVEWGKEFMEYLVLKGALVNVKTKQKETLLHLLYENSEIVYGLADATSYLLDCGVSMNVNMMDISGNTALSYLLLKMHRDIPKGECLASKAGMDFQSEGDSMTNNLGAVSRSSTCVPSIHSISTVDPTDSVVVDAAAGAVADICTAPESVLNLSGKDLSVMSLQGEPGETELVPSLEQNNLHDPGDKTKSTTRAEHVLQRSGTLSPDELEYVRSVELLLNAGANPNIANKVGNTSLHAFVCIPRMFSLGPSHRPHYCSFRLIHSVMELLLSKGANPSFINNTDGSILEMLVVSGCDALFDGVVRDQSDNNNQVPDPSSPDVGPRLPPQMEVDYFCKCIVLLKDYGFPFGRQQYGIQTCLLHSVVNLLNQLEHLPSGQFSLEEQQAFGTEFGRYVAQIVQALLHCGYVLNVCKSVQKDFSFVYYKLMAYASLFPEHFIHDTLVMMLRYGADPNLGGKHIPMSVFRFRSRSENWPVYPLLHLLNTIGCQTMVKKETELFWILEVLYNTMEESNVKQCIFHYLEYDCNHRNINKNHSLIRCLVSLMNSPRRLKQSCAQVIYSDMCQRKVTNVHTLPLPLTMRNYLSDFHY